MVKVKAEIIFDKSDDGIKLTLKDICDEIAEHKDLVDLMLQFSPDIKITMIKEK